MAAVMAVAHESVVQGSASSGMDVPTWAPDLVALKQLITMLQDSSNGNTAVQESLYKQLESYATGLDFNNYLAHILSNGVPTDIISNLHPDDSARIRQAAGLLLKNNLQCLYNSLPRDRQIYINAELQRATFDPLRVVRSSAALCIATVIEKHGITVWPDLVGWLQLGLQSETSAVLDGALTLLCRISEDLGRIISQDRTRSLDAIVPIVIRLCGHVETEKRAMALQIMNHFVVLMPPVMYTCVEAYCRTLFDIADDNNAEVRKRVCTAICLLLQSNPAPLAEYMPSVIKYMLISSKHTNPSIALEAAEFWIIAAQLKDARSTLSTFIPDIVEMLLDNMVYNAEDIAYYDALNFDDAMIPDKPEDVKPRFHTARLREFGNHSSSSPDSDENNHTLSRLGHFATGGGTIDSQNKAELGVFGNGVDPNNNNKTGSNPMNQSIGKSSPNQSDDDDEDGSDNDDDTDGDGEWSVRKCSAKALDSLAGIFNDEILAIILPILNEKLSSDRWEQRECGVLILGAIANGCYVGMENQLAQIFPFLLHLLSDSHYMVRAISCWTLARYSRWFVHRYDESRFELMLAALLKSILDRNKTVQKAAASALASFEEEAGAILNPYIKHILPAIVSAFNRYQRKNIIILYDTICTLADAVGNVLGETQYLNILMPCLISKWNSLVDSDEAILPLLECLTCIFRAIGPSATEFAANVLARCINIIDAVYKLESVNGDQPKNPVHIEFLTCSLDLMCGLAEAIGPRIDPLVANSSNGAKPALPLLFLCMQDSRHEVRQSAFALVGEFARARLPALIPALHDYVHCSIYALNPEYMSVSNNATWALGEMVMMAGFLPSEVPIHRDTIQRSLVDGALDSLINVVNMPQLNKSLIENTAITLGRMGLVIPEPMAPRLQEFAHACFMALRDIRDDAEKEQAAHGMNALVRMNPSAIYDCFVYYVDAIASWYHCKADLEADFAAILAGYRNSLGDQWFALFRSFPPPLQTLLKERFKL